MLKMFLWIHISPSFVDPTRLIVEVCVSHRVRQAHPARLLCMSDQLVTEDLVISCIVVERRKF